MENENAIRVLQYIVSNDKGGLTKYICQNYCFINKNKIQFDFITYDKFLDFEKDFYNKGAKFYRIPKIKNIFKYFSFWRRLQKENKYKIIHFHMSYTNFIPIICARLVGIESIILHAHSTQIDDNRFFIRVIKEQLNFLGKILSKFIVKKYVACSDFAAKWMFPVTVVKKKKYMLAHNAIDLEKYIFNIEIRKQKRKELGISDNCFCIGHIGRFTYQKNHEFLIDIFKEIHLLNKNTRLLLIGNGPLIDKIKEKVLNLNLENNVIFLGNRKDVPSLYNVMDCFVLPSLFEGLPIVGIEAQAAGLPCFFSDTITKELFITNLANYIALNENPKIWAKKIIEYQWVLRKNMSNEIKKNGYDINMEIKNLERYYTNLINNSI